MEDRGGVEREAEPGGPRKQNRPTKRWKVENRASPSMKTGPTYKG